MFLKFVCCIEVDQLVKGGGAKATKSELQDLDQVKRGSQVEISQIPKTDNKINTRSNDILIF